MWATSTITPHPYRFTCVSVMFKLVQFTEERFLYSNWAPDFKLSDLRILLRSGINNVKNVDLDHELELLVVVLVLRFWSCLHHCYIAICSPSSAYHQPQNVWPWIIWSKYAGFCNVELNDFDVQKLTSSYFRKCWIVQITFYICLSRPM